MSNPQTKGGSRPGTGTAGGWVKRDASTGEIIAKGTTRFEAVMAAADRSGLLHGKGGRIGGRISPELIAKAKAQTGIEADTDLIEFALANIAVEDRFAEAFKAVRGAVDADLNLGF
ncbi:hypothetical protein [Sandarakinorhabdus oryzae]|uniref:hypothetical protein n=1 Tax=Sandarakinorhabdus oryzae TaxID=2675220 RepID=UPI001F33C0CD|nr:hypothetical protein [Sandarakinorhabdus oryzae]